MLLRLSCNACAKQNQQNRAAFNHINHIDHTDIVLQKQLE